MLSPIGKVARQTITAAFRILPTRFRFQLPACLFIPGLIARLNEAIAPFHPRGEGTATETVFQHTVKDFIVLQSILANRPENILIGKITFPPLAETDPQAKLAAIVATANRRLGLEYIVGNPAFMRMLDVFVLYHDIGKTTESRKDHEVIGAVMLLQYQNSLCGPLTEKEFAMVHFMIKHHGLYGKLDAARTKHDPLPTYENFILDLYALNLTKEERANVARAVFLFNIAEGLQSDIFSQDFFNTEKLEDILSYYDQVRTQI